MVQTTSTKTTNFILNYIAPSDCILVFIVVKTAPCKYADVGCKVRPLRKDLKKHEENYQLHLRVTTETVLELKKMLPKPVVPVTVAPVTVAPVTYKVADFVKCKTDNDVIYSPSFYTSTNGYKMCLRINANGTSTGEGTHISVFTCLMVGKYDDYLSWPFTGTVTIELLNQLEDNHHHNWTITFPAELVASQRVVDGERGVGRGHHKFISHTNLARKPRKNIQYLNNDTLIFRVSAEAPDYKPWLECTHFV